MRRRTPFSLVLSLGLLLASAADPAAAQQLFVFDLSGDQEVPPVPSPATGGCHGDFDGTDTLDLTCVHDVTGATTAHIHGGAAGVNGPVVFDLGDPTSPITATWTGMTAADVVDLLAGDLYVNVHTAGRPAGEIRGQILERTVDFVPFGMDGSQVVPPSASTATATCTADLSNDATGLQIDCTHDAATADEAHVHQAPAGSVGPVVHTFAGIASPFSELVPVSPEEVAAFAARHLYVELHSPDVPEGGSTDGVIRGQIGTPPAGPTTGTIRIRKATFPAGGTGFGFTDDVPGSPGAFTLDDGAVETFTAVPPGTYTVTEDDPGTTPGGYTLAHVECDDADSAGNRFARTATIALQAGETVTCTFENLELGAAGLPFVFHLSGDQEVPPVASPSSGGCMGLFDDLAGALTLVCTHDVTGATLMHVHRGAPGENGPVVFDLGNPASPVLANWTGMTAGEIADLLAGNLYVNVHTSGRPAGEIRGQILERTRDTFRFPLEGAQQVPPVLTSAVGSCEADLNDAATALFLECTHSVASPTAAHIHAAPAGENGPILIELGNPPSPFSLSPALSPRDVADLVAGFLYVNIHSDEVPGGELRGQIVNQPLSVLEIPTLAEWGLLLLALTLALAAIWRLAR